MELHSLRNSKNFIEIKPSLEQSINKSIFRLMTQELGRTEVEIECLRKTAFPLLVWLTNNSCEIRNGDLRTSADNRISTFRSFFFISSGIIPVMFIKIGQKLPLASLPFINILMSVRLPRICSC